METEQKSIEMQLFQPIMTVWRDWAQEREQLSRTPGLAARGTEKGGEEQEGFDLPYIHPQSVET